MATRRLHWSDWPFLGLTTIVLAMFIETGFGSMRHTDWLIDFGTGLFLLQAAPCVLFPWAIRRLLTPGYSRIPPLCGLASAALAVLTIMMVAVQGAARS